MALSQNNTVESLNDVLINAANDKIAHSFFKECSVKKAADMKITDITLVYIALFAVVIGTYRHHKRHHLNRRAKYHNILETDKKIHAKAIITICFALLFSVYTILAVLIKQQYTYITGYVFGVLGLFNLVRIPFSTMMPKATQRYNLIILYGEIPLNDVLCFISCFILGTLLIFLKHWVINDICGFVISISAIELLTIKSFGKLNMVMFSAIFSFGFVIYIGSTCDYIKAIIEHMDQIDGPHKLLFPRYLLENGVLAAKDFNTLSLADIIIPGILIDFLLKFGQSLKPERIFYFYIALVVSISCIELNAMFAYVCTSRIPAFIIIVPACFLTTTVTTLVFGHFKALIRYDDDNMELKMISE